MINRLLKIQVLIIGIIAADEKVPLERRGANVGAQRSLDRISRYFGDGRNENLEHVLDIITQKNIDD